MIRIGMVSNARSQRNKTGMQALEAVVEDQADMLHARLAEMQNLPEVLKDFARQDVGLVVINGGDGTVQAVLTELLEGRPFETPPPVALLSRGMTNMTAADCGMIGKAAPALQRLLRLARAGELQRHYLTRPVLRLENALGWSPQRGMFFGAAGIVSAIEICRAQVHARGFKAEWANGVTLAGLMLTWLLRGERGPLRGENLRIALDEDPAWESSQLLVLCTTLEKLILNSRPFWNQHGGTMHFTAIAFPPNRLLRYGRRLLYGSNERRLPEESYRSRAVRRVALHGSGAVTLDGQMFEPEPGKPLLLSAEETLRFVRC